MAKSNTGVMLMALKDIAAHLAPLIKRDGRNIYYNSMMLYNNPDITRQNRALGLHKINKQWNYEQIKY